MKQLTEEGARALFRSAEKLKELPDYLEVLPGAFSSSVCGRSLSGKPVSTIGFERKFNAAFRIADEERLCNTSCRVSQRPRRRLRESGP
jgi:hypothetical protein